MTTEIRTSYLRELQNRASTLESTRLEHDAIQTSPIVTISLQSKLGVERTTRLHHASMRGSSPSTLHEQNHQFMTTPDPLRRISRTKHSLYPGQLESDHEVRYWTVCNSIHQVTYNASTAKGKALTDSRAHLTRNMPLAMSIVRIWLER